MCAGDLASIAIRKIALARAGKRSLLKRRKLVHWRCCLPYTNSTCRNAGTFTANGGRPLDAIIGAYAGNSPASGTANFARIVAGKEPIHIPDNVWPSPLPHWQAPGCVHCYHGFYGRTALFEVLPITPVIRQLISANTDVESLETHARQAGMRTLF